MKIGSLIDLSAAWRFFAGKATPSAEHGYWVDAGSEVFYLGPKSKENKDTLVAVSIVYSLIALFLFSQFSLEGEGVPPVLLLLTAMILSALFLAFSTVRAVTEFWYWRKWRKEAGVDNASHIIPYSERGKIASGSR